MSNNFFLFLNKFKNKKLAFNETLTVTYVFNKNLFNYSSYFILPFGTKRNISSFFCSKIFLNINSCLGFLFKVYDDKIFNNEFFKKKYSFYFFDTLSFEKIRSNGIINIFNRKKIKLSYNYNNVSDDIKGVLSFCKNKNLVTYFLSNKRNFINFPFSSFSLSIEKSIKNFYFINKEFFFILKKNNYNTNNIKKIIISSTFKKKIKINDEGLFYNNKK
ncbi:hypothetical protein [Candidatus Vidania fulgoroideorum]